MHKLEDWLKLINLDNGNELEENFVAAFSQRQIAFESLENVWERSGKIRTEGSRRTGGIIKSFRYD